MLLVCLDNITLHWLLVVLADDNIVSLQSGLLGDKNQQIWNCHSISNGRRTAVDSGGIGMGGAVATKSGVCRLAGHRDWLDFVRADPAFGFPCLAGRLRRLGMWGPAIAWRRALSRLQAQQKRS